MAGIGRHGAQARRRGRCLDEADNVSWQYALRHAQLPSGALLAKEGSMTNPLIQKLEYGANLTDDHRRILERTSQKRRQVPRKEHLIREGERPSCVRLVMEGFACRYKLLPTGERQIMAFLVPGDFCDLHVAILGRMDHSIVTLSPCTIVDIPRETIMDLTDNHPAITRALWWATLVDQAVLREWIVGLGQRPAETRIAHLLCELTTRLAAVGRVTDGAFDLPITQEEFADTLGLSIVHTNHMLMNLRDKDLATVQNKRAIIHDFEQLMRFADFTPDYLHLSDRSGVDQVNRNSA
ncbi:Crp/Fnr family transcriptional regulator [Aurantimonas sp. C2-6-R+9]|uniref:Crp/Fnr family transcriptional regulator n=2 Tax=unclassified Aurantimonas TaxID=2638230 RepID=UPI002E174DA0|nr:Crp/Fnr family transcriptional regulator [Aurantimonas sp. C2-6-R+9]